MLARDLRHDFQTLHRQAFQNRGVVAVIGVQRLTRVMETLVNSDRVKDGRGALSAVLMAPSDAGKSALLLSHLPPGARVINDVTTASLLQILDVPKPPHWIVIPDLNQVVSHKPAVAALTMSTLLALLGEGVSEIPGIDGPAKLKATRVMKTRGLNVALLTAMTPEVFFSRRMAWRASGLLRRLMPVYYTYAPTLQAEITRAITSGDDRLNYKFSKLKLAAPRPVNIPNDIAEKVARLSDDVVMNQLKWTMADSRREIRAVDFSFSVHKNFRQYIKTRALINDHKRVTRQDLDELEDFARFIRYDRPESI